MFLKMFNLKLEKINKKIKSGSKEIVILDDLNLEVNEIGFYAITGKSGSGKTTLLQIIAGIEKADSGTVTLNNEEISGYSQEKLSKIRLNNIGIVFQFFNLLPALNIIDNVTIPMEFAGVSKSDAKERAEYFLDKVGILNLANNFPHQVSGGEIQRAAIARALVNKAKLILADEPTGNLDPKTASLVIDLFSSLVDEEKLTLLVVTHSSDIVKKAKTCFTLENGKILN